MKYARPVYPGPGKAGEKNRLLYSSIEVEIPKLDMPVTPLENFRRVAARKKPIWLPNSLTDFQNLMIQELAVGRGRAKDHLIGPDFNRLVTEDYVYFDWFGVQWTWVASAGGAVTTPGVIFLDDITNWERVVKFPSFDDWDWQTKADDFLKNEYDPNKVLHLDIGPGCIQRLISILGGYTEGMFALALEPEAVKAFFSRYADFMIELVDHLLELYPADLMTIHDDWGTELDTFYSPQMMEQLVFEPTNRIVRHIKSKDCAFMLHSCGNVSRFIPYMIDMNIDFLQLQRRAVDIPAMKAKYGEKIGFNAGIEGLDFGIGYTKNELLEKIRHTADVLGKGGGCFINIFERDPVLLWDSLCELYYYSREKYEAEQT